MTSADHALPLRALAPAKINLGLFVGPTRADGRHEIVSVMQSISLADELTLEPAPDAEHDQVVCPGVTGENLAARALALFREATGWDAGSVRLEIDKHIPVAAGLGGGSADAAAALRLARAASGLGDEDLLLVLAGELGADVPAQVAPGRWLASGAGELLQALPDPFSPLGVLVLAGAAQLSTAEVYAAADRLGIAREASRCGHIATCWVKRSSWVPHCPATWISCTTTCRRPPSSSVPRLSSRSGRHWGPARRWHS